MQRMDNVDKDVTKGDGWKFDKTKVVVYCKYFIKRKNRHCSHRVAANSDGFCSDHTPTGLAESRIIDLQSRIRHECNIILSDITRKICATFEDSSASHPVVHASSTKKMRVSAPKRMANPFRYLVYLLRVYTHECVDEAASNFIYVTA